MTTHATHVHQQGNCVHYYWRCVTVCVCAAPVHMYVPIMPVPEADANFSVCCILYTEAVGPLLYVNLMFAGVFTSHFNFSNKLEYQDPNQNLLLGIWIYSESLV